MQYTVWLCCLVSIFLMNTEIEAQELAAKQDRKIKVLFTAAVIPGKPKYIAQRKRDYITNLQKLKNYGCEVYVVESCQAGPTYLDDYCDHICYTMSNDTDRSKSNNEVLSMRIGFKHFNFDPDDMIIKITGRYVLQTDEFIRLVQENINADIIARLWNPFDAYTGLFAIKASVFLDLMDNYYLNIIDNLKYTQPQQPRIGNYAIEHCLANYISSMKDNLNVVLWPRLYQWLPNAHTRMNENILRVSN